MISVTTDVGIVRAMYSNGEAYVHAEGSSFSEAVENLIIRFKELQEEALTELQDRGLVHVPRAVNVPDREPS